MRNILKNGTNAIPTRLLSQQQILNLTQRLILKMIPPSPPHISNPPQNRNGGTYVLVSPYKNAGALTICFPSLHRLHLNVS